MKRLQQILTGLAVIAVLAGRPNTSRAVDYHVTTAQELQNALTLAAANGADDNIYLAAGYYTGNFNFNSTENRNLLLQGETGTTNTQITLDGAATGRDMNLTNSGTGNFTVRGITFLRNCGSASIGALRLAGSAASTLLVDTCRFLSPTNASALGMGLEIAAGQNVSVINSAVIGTSNTVNQSIGIQIQGVGGNISVGNCNLATNSYDGLSINGGGTVNLSSNNISGNLRYAVNVTGAGAITLQNNIILRNGSPSFGANFTGNNAIVIVGNFFGNNVGSYGAGCQVSWGSATATLLCSNNVFANNGGIGASFNSAITANTNLFSITRNTFNHNGNGGLYLISYQERIMVSGNSFTQNSGNQGAVRCYVNSASASPVTFTNNTFSGNSCSGNGGAINTDSANYGYTGVTNLINVIAGNLFVGNTATGAGGAVYSTNLGSSTFFGNVFRQNSAGQSGGAICASGSTLSIIDNLVVKNSENGVSYAGGGIYVNPTAKLTLVHNTLADNTAAGSGGGLACAVGGTTEILEGYNNIIWGNSASGNGGDVWLAGTGFKKTFMYNDVSAMYGVWDITANLLDVAPAFFDPVNGDYHLRSTSACLNAGTNGIPAMPATDLDGNNRTNAAIVDLGGYEFNNTVFHPADVNQDWVISAQEYTNYAAAWKNSQAWFTAPTQIPADYVTRAGYLQNLGGSYHNDGAGAPLGWKTGP